MQRVKWEKAVPRSDKVYPDNASRQRAYRERKREAAAGAQIQAILRQTAHEAAEAGDKTARTFLRLEGEPDLLVRIVRTFRARRRQLQFTAGLQAEFGLLDEQASEAEAQN